MRKVILFVLIISAFNSFAQDTTKTTKIKRFYVGINFSPDMDYRTIHNNDTKDTIAKWITNIRDTTEAQKFGFTTGINMCYYITKRISVEFGVQYSNKGYQEKERQLIWGSQNNGFVVAPNEPVKGRFIYSYNYIDIPIKANFLFGKKKTQFITAIGLTTNILLFGENVFEGKTQSGKPYKSQGSVTNGQARANLSPMISAGIQYGINPKLFFRIEPTFKFGIINTNINGPIAQYLWSGGINCSFYF